MATFNGGKYLREQLDSILSQLSPDDELIVSDDGSTDATVHIVQSYGPRIRLIGTERVGGVVLNFERALKAAHGNFIVLADQDDVWLDGRINKINLLLQKFDLVLLNGAVVDANLIRKDVTVFQMIGVRSGFVRSLWSNKYIGCCMAFRRELRDIVVPFPSRVPWHDWYIGLVAEILFKVVHVDELTLLYRRHGANFSPTGERSKTTLLGKLLMRWYVLRAVLVACARSVLRPSRY